MKKLFLGAGLFAGLTVSVLSLASCKNGATVKDVDGSNYVIKKTEDAGEVSKALLLSLQNGGAENGKKIFAFSTDIKVAYDGKLDIEGATANVKLNSDLYAGFTMGTKTFKKIERPAGESSNYTEKEYEEATKQIQENVAFALSATGEVEVSNVVADGVDYAPAKEALLSLNNDGKFTGSIKAFTSGEYMYSEGVAKIPAAFATSVNSQAENSFYNRSKYDFTPFSPFVSNAFYCYQEATSFNDFLAKIDEVVRKDMEVERRGWWIENIPTKDDFPTIDKDYFKSSAYDVFKQKIDDYDVKISDVSGSLVTFSADVKSSAFETLMNAFNITQLSNGENLFSISLTLDSASGRPTAFKAESKNLYKIGEIGTAKFGNQSALSYFQEHFSAIDGKLSIDASFKYNEKVSFMMVPTEGKY